MGGSTLYDTITLDACRHTFPQNVQTRVSPDVNSVFGVIMMCYVDSLTVTNHLVGDVDSGEGCVCQGWGERNI